MIQLSPAKRFWIKPSLITLDIMMPGRDGWSVLQELKDDPDLCNIPVIMVSMIDDKKMNW